MLVTIQAPSLPAGRRFALIISTGTYIDDRLPDLRGPTQDASDLGEILRDPEYGGYEVSELLNKSKTEIEETLISFLDRRRDETVLVYLSCHGLQTPRGEFYLAAANTRTDAIPATALEGRWLTDRLNECRARRQIVILDACFSGAFIGAKGNLETSFEWWRDGIDRGEPLRDGRGRAVLTASRAAQFSFEGPGADSSESPVRSVFSRALIEGLRTGDADTDHDGLVSVPEAFEYASERVPAQNPQIMYRGEGRFFLVRSPKGRPADPALMLRDPSPEVRIAALDIMAGWLDDPDPGKAQAAQIAMDRAAKEDIPQVRLAAQARLARSAGLQGPAGPVQDPAVGPAPVAAAGVGPRETAGAGDPKTASPSAGGSPRRPLRLAAVISIVVAGALIAVVGIKIALFPGHGPSSSCPAVTPSGSHRVAVPGGSTSTALVICPVQVEHEVQPGLKTILSGLTIGQLPPGQLLVVVSQPDRESCDLDHNPGSGGYYQVGGQIYPAADHGHWTLTSGSAYPAARSIQWHYYFLLGPQSALSNFNQAKAAYGQAHNEDYSAWPGNHTLSGFRVIGTFTLTPVRPANRYCRNS